VSEALNTWRKKLDYLHQQEATVSDPAQKFTLAQQIEEAKAKIAELVLENSSVSGSVASSRTVFPTRFTIILPIVLVLLGILAVASFVAFPKKKSNPEIAELKASVEEMQKRLPQPLNPKQIEHEAELRKEEPNQFRGDSIYWPNGSTVHIAFLDGDKALQEKVFSIAKEWTKYANLTFVRSKPPDSDVRVSFSEPGEWSYMGTQCRSIPKNEKTTNIHLDSNNELENRFVILHTFGHVLGLIHEHQAPSAKHLVNMDKARVMFHGPPNYWSSEVVDRTLLPFDDAGGFYNAKPYDPYSVMLYKFPAEILNPGMAIEPGDQLSPGDIALIRKIYPGR